MSTKSPLHDFPKQKLGATCFANLPDNELKELAFHKESVQYDAGEIVFRQGNFPSSVMFILDGYVKEFIESPDGKYCTFRILKQGDFVALSGLFNNNVYSYSASTITPSTLCLFNKEYLLELIKKRPEISLRLMQRYSALEIYLIHQLKGNLFKQMNGKMAQALLYIDSFNEENGVSLFEFFSRKDLSEFATISIANTTRVLKNFESDGIISINERLIKINDRKKLEIIAQIG